MRAQTPGIPSTSVAPIQGVESLRRRPGSKRFFVCTYRASFRLTISLDLGHTELKIVRRNWIHRAGLPLNKYLSRSHCHAALHILEKTVQFLLIGICLSTLLACPLLTVYPAERGVRWSSWGRRLTDLARVRL